MDGPPTSICSMASADAHSSARHGRLETGRDSLPPGRSAESRALSPRRCGRPVLCRTGSRRILLASAFSPVRPKTSGAPDHSAMEIAGIAASARCRAVPPVESISTPRSTRNRASSMIPDLSETERIARRIEAPPAAVTGDSPVAALAKKSPIRSVEACRGASGRRSVRRLRPAARCSSRR